MPDLTIRDLEDATFRTIAFQAEVQNKSIDEVVRNLIRLGLLHDVDVRIPYGGVVVIDRNIVKRGHDADMPIMRETGAHPCDTLFHRDVLHAASEHCHRYALAVLGSRADQVDVAQMRRVELADDQPVFEFLNASHAGAPMASCTRRRIIWASR